MGNMKAVTFMGKLLPSWVTCGLRCVNKSVHDLNLKWLNIFFVAMRLASAGAFEGCPPSSSELVTMNCQFQVFWELISFPCQSATVAGERTGDSAGSVSAGSAGSARVSSGSAAQIQYIKIDEFSIAVTKC